MSTRRAKLTGRVYSQPPDPNSTHAGLWLDKFICNQGEKAKCPDVRPQDKNAPEPKTRLVREVAKIGEPDDYKNFFDRWKTGLARLNTVCAEAELIKERKMAVGLGAEGVLENSLAIHRTWGMPYIPGSALKGLAASFAHQHLGAAWHRDGELYNLVFGKTDDAGFITFYDALFVSGSGKPIGKQPFAAQTLTPHHKDYYQAKPDKVQSAPADWDDPMPIPFLAATGKYLIAISVEEGGENLRTAAWQVLIRALEHEGIGAKTSSGFGRLKISEEKK